MTNHRGAPDPPAPLRVPTTSMPSSCSQCCARRDPTAFEVDARDVRRRRHGVPRDRETRLRISTRSATTAGSGSQPLTGCLVALIERDESASRPRTGRRLFQLRARRLARDPPRSVKRRASLDEHRARPLGSWAVDSTTRHWSHELYRMLGFGRAAPGTTSSSTASTPTIASNRRAAGRVEDAVRRRTSQSARRPERGCARGRVEPTVGRTPPRHRAGHHRRRLRPTLSTRSCTIRSPDSRTARLLVDRLDQALARLARVRTIVGVIHLDIDRFKLINDNLGHDVGDQLLVATARRLQRSRSAPRTRSPGSTATSSSCCARDSPIRPRPSSSPTGSARR